MRSQCAHWLRNDRGLYMGAGKESPSHGFAVPAPFRQGGQLRTRDADCHSRCAHRLRNDMVFCKGGAVQIRVGRRVIGGAVGRGTKKAARGRCLFAI